MISHALILTLVFASFGSLAAKSQCQGLSEKECSSDDSCTWVSGYEQKDGDKVKAYCRAKPGKGSEAKKDKKKKDKEEVAKSLEETMQEVNKLFDKHEKMKKVVVMQEEWTVDNNLLTPTMKVKRNVLEKEKTPNYEKWYSDTNIVVWEN